MLHFELLNRACVAVARTHVAVVVAGARPPRCACIVPAVAPRAIVVELFSDSCRSSSSSPLALLPFFLFFFFVKEKMSSLARIKNVYLLLSESGGSMNPNDCSPALFASLSTEHVTVRQHVASTHGTHESKFARAVRTDSTVRGLAQST